MKQLLTTLLLVLFMMPATAQEQQETTTYYLVRHAEKDRSDPNNKNPNLTMEGVLRAAKWSMVLENIDLDAVYSTDYNRTKQTAQPTAEKKQLEVQIYDPRNIDMEAFKKSTKGQTVFIVGHSNTTPMFVNALIGSKKYQAIDDRNNANLYIVTLTETGVLKDQVLLIE